MFQYFTRCIEIYLPAQNPLKDFFRRNTLHALKFFEGIHRASEIFEYKVSLSLNEFRNLYKTGQIRKIF